MLQRANKVKAQRQRAIALCIISLHATKRVKGSRAAVQWRLARGGEAAHAKKGGEAALAKKGGDRKKTEWEAANRPMQTYLQYM